MKKIIVFIVIFCCIFPLKRYILNNQVTNISKKNKTQISQDYSYSKKDSKNSLSVYDNEKKSNNILKDIPNTKNKNFNTILVNIDKDEYMVAFDYNKKEVVINKNLYDSDKYIKLQYEEVLPIVKNIDNLKNLSISQYINLYSKLSPHIDTNMSYAEILSLASNININNLKSNYENLPKTKNNN